MRILIKGGVWKNTEDEILKAAVMKYGLNQWARISSFLTRKSAKQCKARWYEWLDPSIKKTEWTRDEDEKLLHLAKLMPTQWRTIAPIVGRTPNQCLERYEKLLDQAFAKDDNYEGKDDPRRLRAGEIDPNPEAKPARPDPVDMDEDEKEMLSEARARLANTKGKKAKRKAREKQLEEARRLAALQKKRELKAAGIELRSNKRAKRGIDYNNEVAFEQKPQAGFYDTGEEAARTAEVAKEFTPMSLEELEGKRRKEIEDGLIKRDLKKAKIAERGDAGTSVARSHEVNDSGFTGLRRGKLMLPAPQVSAQQLQALAAADAAGPSGLDAGGAAATRALLADPSATPGSVMQTALRTPLRTPTNEKGDYLLREAASLARMQAQGSALQGGESVDIEGSDFSGVTPQRSAVATPNPLAAAATPMTAGGVAGATPSTSIAGIPHTPGAGHASLRAGATPAATPRPDTLGLNNPDAAGDVGKRAAAALRAGLGSLPAPANEYKIVVPELPQDEASMATDGPEEDAADVEARRAKQAKLAAERAEKERTAVLRRSLPRPVAPEGAMVVPSALGAEPSARERADAELAAEVATLIGHDAATVPLGRAAAKLARKKATVEKPAGPLEYIPLEALEAASAVLKAEAERVRSMMGHANKVREYDEAWDKSKDEWIWSPAASAWVTTAGASRDAKVTSWQEAFGRTKKEMDSEYKKSLKLESKVNILTKGLQARHEKLLGQLSSAHAAACAADTELACFQALSDRESRALPARLSSAREALARQAGREKELQERYKQLCDERDDLAAVVVG